MNTVQSFARFPLFSPSRFLLLGLLSLHSISLTSGFFDPRAQNSHFSWPDIHKPRHNVVTIPPKDHSRLAKRARPAPLDPSNLPSADDRVFAQEEPEWRQTYASGMNSWTMLRRRLTNPTPPRCLSDELLTWRRQSYPERHDARWPLNDEDACSAFGILTLTDDEFNAQADPNEKLCYPSYHDEFFTSIFDICNELSCQVSISAQAIVTGITQNSERDLRDDLRWCDIASTSWAEACLRARVDQSVLKYLIYPRALWDMRFEQERAILSLLQKTPSTGQNARFNSYEGEVQIGHRLTYSTTDADFYTILGTRPSQTLISLLTDYASLFASRDAFGNSKVKTIDRIHIGSQNDLTFKRFTGLDIVFVLKDIDPPVLVEPETSSAEADESDSSSSSSYTGTSAEENEGEALSTLSSCQTSGGRGEGDGSSTLNYCESSDGENEGNSTSS